MRCTDLHIKKKKKERTERDPLSDDHRDKMCLYSAFSRRRRRMKLFPLSDGRAGGKKKGSCAKLTDSPLNGGEVGGRWEGGFVSQIAACLNRKVRVEDVKILSPADVMGLSVLVCVCVRACRLVHFRLEHPRQSVSARPLDEAPQAYR